MLLPALAKAREKARATSCMNNLRQVQLAINIYFTECEQNFFYSGNASSQTWQTNPTKANMWSTFLLQFDYIKDAKQLFCPSTLNEALGGTNRTYSYGANYVVAQPFVINVSYLETKTSASNLGMIHDCYSIESQHPYYRSVNDGTSKTYGRPYLIHNNYCNMSFADGHCEAMGRGNLSDKYTLTLWKDGLLRYKWATMVGATEYTQLY